MSVEEKLDEFIKKSESQRHESLGYTFFALSLATLSIAIANASTGSSVVSGIATLILLVLGFVNLFCRKK